MEIVLKNILKIFIIILINVKTLKNLTFGNRGMEEYVLFQFFGYINVSFFRMKNMPKKAIHAYK